MRPCLESARTPVPPSGDAQRLDVFLHSTYLEDMFSPAPQLLFAKKKDTQTTRE